MNIEIKVIKIHPFDLADIVNKRLKDDLIVSQEINIHKDVDLIEIDGVYYWQDTDIPAESKNWK